MSIISYIKKFFTPNSKVHKIKVLYLKAFKAYDFAANFAITLRMMIFDNRNIFIRTYEDTVVYMILKKDDTLFLFIPKSYLEEVEKFSETHKFEIIGDKDNENLCSE